MAKRAKPVSRRSFVGLVTGATAAAIAAPAAARIVAEDNDSDAVNTANPEAKGRNGELQVTDADAGRNRDCAGSGRGSSNGFSDQDPNDPAGRGRSGLTDADEGNTADRAGRGRGRGSCAS